MLSKLYYTLSRNLTPIPVDPEPNSVLKKQFNSAENIIKSGIPSASFFSEIHAVFFDIYGTLFISGSGDIGTIIEKISTNNESNNLGLLKKAFKAAGISPSGIPDDGELPRVPDLFLEGVKKSHMKSCLRGIEFPEVDCRRIWHEVFFCLHEKGIIQEIPAPTTLLQFAVCYEALLNPVWPMPYSLETLKILSTHGYLLGIVSNAQFYTPLLFSAFFHSSPKELGFHNKYSSWSYRIGEAKPSTRLFSDILNNVYKSKGIKPHQILYVGNDMLNDIYTAGKTGCRTALFAGDRRSFRPRINHPLVKNIKPDILITSLSHLVPLLCGCHQSQNCRVGQ